MLPGAVAVLVIALTLFVLFPLFRILEASVRGGDGTLTLAAYAEMFSSGKLLLAFRNTLVVGVLVAVLATAVGFLFAYAVAVTRTPGKRLFRLLAVLPVISPPFVISLSVLLLFGRRGFITAGLLGLQNVNIYGLQGLVLTETLAYFPLAFLVLVGMLEGIDPSLEEAAANAGASRWQVFRTITLPIMVPGVANSMLLVFSQSLADFGNPMVIGGNFTTLPVQVYLQVVGSYDHRGGAALATLLLTGALAAYLLQKYWVGRKSYVTVTGKPARAREPIQDPVLTVPLFIVCGLISALVLVLYLLVPVGAFIKLWGVDHSLTLSHFRYAMEVGRKAILDTTQLALLSAPITGLLGMIVAYLVVRGRFFGKSALEFAAMLPMAVPGTVIGVAYVLTFNTPPLVLTGTAAILLLAFIFRTMPVGIRSGVAALHQIDPAIEEASTNLGASTLTTFTGVVLPLIRPAFFAGLTWSFAKSMTTLSSIVFLVSARHNALTAAVMNQVELGRFGPASALCTILIGIVLAFMAASQAVLRRLGVKFEITGA